MTNIKPQSAFDQHRIRLNKAYVELVENFRPFGVIYLTFNQRYSQSYCLGRLRDLEKRLNDKLVCRRWQDKQPERRIRFLAFMEKADTNPHWNVFYRHGPLKSEWRLWDERKKFVRDFPEWVEFFWRGKLVPSGTVHISNFWGATQFDIDRQNSYGVKEATPDQEFYASETGRIWKEGIGHKMAS